MNPAAATGLMTTDRGPFGHPKGLFALFMTEMWERLAFYINIGILLLYCIDTERGGLGMTGKHAAEIYGTYMAFVYFTPFLGGMIADRFLGYRLAVFIGGLCLAAGYFLLGVRGESTLLGGLAMLCVGNGLFKPNISAMVGNLYTPGDPKRDSGFNIFYMGINIGASLSALLSAPLRNEWSFNAAFIGAGIGMLIGVAVLVMNWKKLASADRPPERDPRDAGMGRVLLTILLPAALFGIGGYLLAGGWARIGYEGVPQIKNTIGPITFAFVVGMAPVLFYFVSLVWRATPDEKPGLAALLPVYLAGGAFFMVLHLSGGLMTVFTEHRASREGEWMPQAVDKYYCQNAMPSYFGNADPSLPRPHEDTLLVASPEVEAMFGARRISEGSLQAVQRDHPELKIVDKSADPAGLTAKWGFLVQQVFPADQIKVTTDTDSHGVTTVSVSVPETAKPLRQVLIVKDHGGETFPVLLITQETRESVYAKASDTRLPKGTFISLLNAELITGFLNPFYVVALTPLVVAFFAWRVKLGKPVSTARKILYGILLTFVSVLIIAAGAYLGGDGASKASLWWLVIYYLVITVGELCLSPMGLSLVTKLSPKRLVGLMMGGWFVATSVGNKLAGFITGLPPTTLVFVVLGICLLGVALLILAVLPMLDRAIKKYGA